MKRADQLRRRGKDKGALEAYYDSARRIRDREPGLSSEKIADRVLSGLGMSCTPPIGKS